LTEYIEKEEQISRLQWSRVGSVVNLSGNEKGIWSIMDIFNNT